MKVIHMGTLVYAEPKPATVEERTAKHNQILADLDCPIELGRATKLAHDAKTDRYAVTFHPASEKVLTLKVTNELAAFLAEHIAAAGYWRGRMESGALVDACLIQSI